MTNEVSVQLLSLLSPTLNFDRLEVTNLPEIRRLIFIFAEICSLLWRFTTLSPARDW